MGTSSKNNILQVIIIILVLILGYCSTTYLYNKIIDKTESIESEVDGKKYKVRSQHDSQDKKETADYLATISEKVNILVDYMYKNKLPDEVISKRLKDRWHTKE